MDKRTINDAIKIVLQKEGKPMGAKEIYLKIKEQGIYSFKAANPENIVRNQLRRHSENISGLQAASQVKHFVYTSEGKYRLKS
jgi:hypothetical protein